MGQTTEELNSQIAGTREALASDVDALSDKVSPRAAMNRQKSAMADRWQGLRSKVMGSVDVSSAGSVAVDTVKGTAGGMASSTQDGVKGSPIAAGVVAFGAGMLIAGLLPSTKRETELSQRAVQAVKDNGEVMDGAKSAGRDLAEGVTQHASQAVDEVKSTAAESAQRVSDEGASAAHQVASEAR
jgi:Protein of unknown function (DUF3618)